MGPVELFLIIDLVIVIAVGFFMTMANIAKIFDVEDSTHLEVRYTTHRKFIRRGIKE